MKRRRILLLLALAVVAAAALILCRPRGPKEPVYQGKRLSEWIGEANSSPVLNWRNPGSPQASEVARQSIRAIGTNALPWLLSEFGRSESKWRARFNGLAGGRLPRRFRFDTGFNRIATARDGLIHLGPAVAPALPALARYIDDSEHGGHAVLAMTGAGGMALPYLLNALRSTNALTGTRALDGLTFLAPTVEDALPPVLQSMQHTNKAMRERVLYFLADFKQRPDQVIPALTNALSDPDGDVKRLASFALAKWGDAAWAALPDLRRLMTHSDPVVAAVAKRAVQEIDPTARPQRKQE